MSTGRKVKLTDQRQTLLYPFTQALQVPMVVTRTIGNWAINTLATCRSRQPSDAEAISIAYEKPCAVA